jgi:hypothetical protein
MSPRALVIAYDFPPHGAIGTMRTLRVVRQLHADGWQVAVLTGCPTTYLPGTPVERSLESQVPPGVEVMRVRAVRPFNAIERMMLGRSSAVEGSVPSRPGKTPGRSRRSWLAPVASAKNFVEAVLDIPDKESGWIAPAVARGLRYIISTKPDVIYSSAPPWSGQAVALTLAAASRLPWVADFRDPWARAPWRDWRKPFRQRAAATLERRVVGRADAVLFVTRANVAEFSAFYGPSAASRFHLIPNGCDPSELEGVVPERTRSEFVLLHAGTLYGARTPLPIIHAIARAIARGALDRTRFRLRLVGNLSLSIDLPAECARLGIADVVELVPRVTRAESLREMASASALLLIQTGTTVSIPAKAYEYLAVGRPILALSEEGETADLVRASGVGVSVRPDDPAERIEAAVLEIVAIASRGYSPAPPELFDGRVHAKATERLLRDVVGSGRRDAPGRTRVPLPAAAPSREESPR